MRVPPHWDEQRGGCDEVCPGVVAGRTPGGLTAGIDRASEDHAVCIVDGAGQAVSRFWVGHLAQGLRELVQRVARAGAAEAAIERGDGPVVDALLGAGLTVVVISPGQVKNLRSRYGAEGNKESRRPVVAQVLSYAGYLQGLDPEQLETRILGKSVIGAVQASDQLHAVDAEDFRDGLTRSLAEGGFRLMIVLDTAPGQAPGGRLPAVPHRQDRHRRGHGIRI
jgi:hypothetical protein